MKATSRKFLENLNECLTRKHSQEPREAPNTVVSVFTNAGHNPIVVDSASTNTLQLANTATSPNYVETVLQEFTLEDGTEQAASEEIITGSYFTDACYHC